MDQLKQIDRSYQEFKQELDMELLKAVEGFVKIGYLLKVARDTAVLHESGYKTVAEFAQAEYGLTKDVVSRYIAINDRYSENGYSECLQEQYRPYGVAKLGEMLTLSDEAISMLSPDMTRTEIQHIKKEIRQEEQITDLEVMIEGQTDQQQSIENNLGKVLHQYFFDNYKEYAQLQKALVKLEDAPDEIVLDVMAPSGLATKMIRVQGLGKFMLSIKGTDQAIELLNVRSNEKESYSWEDCVFILYDMCPAGNPKKHWEKLYGIPYPEEVAPVQPKKPEEPLAAEPPKQPQPIQEEPDPAEEEPEEPEPETPEPEEPENNVINLQDRREAEKPEVPVITGPEERNPEPEPQPEPEEAEVAPVQPENTQPEQPNEAEEHAQWIIEEHIEVILTMIKEELQKRNYKELQKWAGELQDEINHLLDINKDKDCQIPGQIELEDLG